MRITEATTLPLALLAAGALALSSCAQTEPAHDDHAGHDHDTPAAHDDHSATQSEDDHDDEPAAADDHDDEAADDHDDKEEVGHVELTIEQQRRIGLSLEVARTGTVAIPLELPGTIILDPDGEVFVTPLATGIVAAVPVGIGERVEAGTVLAEIDSAELAEAKLAYVAAAAEVGWGAVSVPRAREIFESVNALITLVQTDAPVAELVALDGREMGAWRAEILSALAERRLAAATLARERTLHEQKVASQQEVQEAEAAAARAEAELAAVLDTARYEVLSTHAAALQAQQMAELALVSARTQLHLLGVDEHGMAALGARLQTFQALTGESASAKTRGAVAGESEVRELGRYQLRAPRAGILIERNLAIGERVADDSSAARIVDTSTVWVRVNVYQRQLPFVRLGAVVTVGGQGLATPVEGVVARISPIVDPQTRTVEALISLPNPSGELRPGLYVTAAIAGGSTEPAVVVPKNAVQIVGEREVVFVPEGDGYAARPVRTGAADKRQIIISEGLKAGTQVVVGGAFELKAKIVTAELGGHAGHGH